MRKLFTAFILLFALTVNAQSLQRIQEEENPTYKEVTNNSEYAKLWRDLVKAKHSENIPVFKNLLSDFSIRYPGIMNSVPINSNMPMFCGASEEPNNPDWGTLSINISNSTVAAGGTNTFAGENPRTIRLRSDSLGIKYYAFINTTRDTLSVYKSSNNGFVWTQVQKLLGGGRFFHSFDFNVTDSANTIKLGFAVSTVSAPGLTDGNLYFITMTGTGIPGIINTVQPTPSGRGFINPAIMSDGSQHSTATTSWYIVYSNYSPSTPAANEADAALTMTWGATWVYSVARTSFNDYDLDIDYVSYPAVDSIYVILANNLTLTNANLRVRKIALSSFLPGGVWTQVNPANSASPEQNSELCVNRKTGQILCTFTATIGGVDHICYNYTTPGGPSFNTSSYYNIAFQTNNTVLPDIDVSPWDTTYRVTYISRGTGFDSLSYAYSNNAASGFTGYFPFTSISNGGSSSVNIAPTITDFKSFFTSGYVPGLGYVPASNLTPNYNSEDVLATGIIHTPSLVKEFNLSQNYPNPFNPSTIIKYSIPANGFVTLKVYDLLGKEVSSLVNSYQISGEYTADFNTSDLNLSSGMYYYKLSIGNFNDVKKMMLIK
ncbi:hypothetical protein BH10BAC5_BH10BAC5_01970 [soil metagenome]